MCDDAENLHNFFTLLHSTCRSYVLASCSMAPPSKLTMVIISPLTEGVQLTPVRQRRSRISYCQDLPLPLAYVGDKKAKRFHFSEIVGRLPYVRATVTIVMLRWPFNLKTVSHIRTRTSPTP